MGTMTFGDSADETESEKIFARCREVGINFFDCANGYASGRSEIILGKLIANCRDEVVITSKSGFPQSDEINNRGSSRRHLQLQVEASLKRLNTDRIDVYFIHRFDPDTPIESVVRTLDDLVQQGKILYPAISNWAAWQIAKALGVAAGGGLARAEVLQPMYSLVKRQAEVEILPLAQAEGLGVIPYSPLAGGFLTGKYRRDAPPEGARADAVKNRYLNDRGFGILDRLDEVAQPRNASVAQVSLAWLLANPVITSPIIGANSVEQLQETLKATEIELSGEEMEKLNQVSAWQ